jgi:parvulin-like peptidyl-prolyl isomerase
MRCSVLLLAAIPVFGADVVVIDEIVAKVNGDIITHSDLETARKELRGSLTENGQRGAALEAAFRQNEPQILATKIDNLLLVQKAKQMSINVDTQVSRQLAQLQSSSKIADAEKFHQAILEQTGMTFEDYKSQMKDSLLTQTVVRQEVVGRINISKAELQQYYDEHKNEYMRKERVILREIMLNTEGKDPDAIEKKAKDLVARAKRGERFPDMARENSDSATAPDGGYIGGVEKDNLSDDLRFLFDQERGFVSEPLKRAGGYHILRVDEHQREGLASLEEMESEIMDKLFSPRIEPKLREYLTQLRQDAFLEIKEGYTDSSAAPGKLTAWSQAVPLVPQTVRKEEVASELHRKRLFWLVPIPGTQVEQRSLSR